MLSEAKDELSFIEFHDALVSQLVITPIEPSIINFRHLPVYHKVADEIYDIWSYEGSLNLWGTRSVILNGLLVENDRIMDLSIRDDNGKDIDPLTSVGNKVRVREIDISFFNGAEIYLLMSEISIVLTKAIEKFEIWKGRLT